MVVSVRKRHVASPASHAAAQFHARVRAGEPGLTYYVVWWSVVRATIAAYRVRAVSTSNVPRTGGVILAPNHSSYLDHFLVAGLAGRRLSFMAKSELFRWPLRFINRLGAFPVMLGARDEEAMRTALAVLERGGCLVVYCEGGISHDGRLREQAKRGIGRLALLSGAPVVPVAILDAHHINRLRFPRVTVRFGPALRFAPATAVSRQEERAAADEVFGEITRLHRSLSADGHAAARQRGPTSGARWPRRRR